MMPKQAFDHTSFIEGTLQKYKNIGWDKQVVLDQGPRSLWLMQAKHVDHSDGTRGIALQIEHYRKNTNSDEFAAPELKFDINEEAVTVLFEYLERQKALEGISLGTDYVAIPMTGQAAGLSLRQKGSLSNLVQQLFQQQDIKSLMEQGILTEATVRGIAVSAQHIRYKTAVGELEGLLSREEPEQTYQNWFKEHTWVLGTSYVGKEDLRRIGLHHISDIILKTVDGYLDLIELKRPGAEILNYDTGRDTYYFSHDAATAIAQCAGYITKTEENRHMLAREQHLLFLKPRARVIMGRSSSWTPEKRDALRVLNGSLHFIEVLTYDHVLAMAKQLILHYEPLVEQEAELDEEDIPF